jgi:hypothetical protein
MERRNLFTRNRVTLVVVVNIYGVNFVKTTPVTRVTCVIACLWSSGLVLSGCTADSELCAGVSVQNNSSQTVRVRSSEGLLEHPESALPPRGSTSNPPMVVVCLPVTYAVELRGPDNKAFIVEAHPGEFVTVVITDDGAGLAYEVTPE